ncbi:hypothetical protein SAMN04488515_2527 [Cognatiyoonia koreensis]|uniref:Uncharacterized protein n=1 Tax=Cognatiyoonia koreensis TaxID=364200 RepID=A0A1I0RDT4_9RHOB|nr:hypothetical protein [Cognatiyoonia koreensis]SEW38903.1 hypothetical protein SAMN04488515_2527 [Cognatiyoonia koreensis]
MTLPAPIQSQLSKNEIVLWDAKPDAPERLSAYAGWHTWVARVFFAISAVMTLLIWTNIGAFGAGRLTWEMIALVGGPIAIGLAIRFGFAWRARDAMRRVHYVVTNQRVLIQTRSQTMSFKIRPDMPAEIIKGRNERDVVRLTEAGQFTFVNDDDIHPMVYTLPKGMVLARADAVLALKAIDSVKAMK